jgi:WD40 repeat protein
VLRGVQLPAAEVLSEPERSFLAASQRLARRTIRNRRLLAVLGAAAALGAVEYRENSKTRAAEERSRLQGLASEQLVTQSEVEQGRAALLHGESADARRHLSEAHKRGDHAPATEFMFARTLQPLAAEQARFPATSGRMWSVAYSPDGQRVVTTDDQAAQVWDAATKQRLLVLPHGEKVYQAIYTAGGRQVITAAGDGRVRIWDAVNGARAREMSHDRGDGKVPRYYRLTLSPDGKLVAAIDSDGDAADVWDVGTGRLRASLRSDSTGFPSIAFSPDGRWLVVGGGDDVRVYDTGTLVRAATIRGPHIRCLSFEPTGARLVTGSLDGEVAIWSMPTGARVRSLPQGDPVDRIAWSPSGDLIAGASRDGTVRVWDAASGRSRNHGNYVGDKILDLGFDAASTLVVAAGSNGEVVISDALLGTPLVELAASNNVVRTVRFDPTSRQIVTASYDGTVRIWDATPSYRRWTSPPITDNCGLLANLEPDRRFIAVGCRDHSTRIWDTAHDNLLAELPSITHVDDSDFVTAFPAVDAEGDRAAVIRGDAVEIYEIPGGRLLRTIDHHAAASAIAFAPAGHDLVSGDVRGGLLVTSDGREPRALPSSAGAIDATTILADGRVVAADASKRIRFLDPERAAPIAELEMPFRARLLRLSPNLRRLVTVPSYNDSSSAALWDLDRYQLVARLDGHAGQTRSARFVRGGQEILTTGVDGTARAWDGSSGRPLRTYQASGRQLTDAVISPDDAMVVAGGADGKLRFWDRTTARPLWTLPVHGGVVTGLHFEGSDIITRGFGGDISRWALPKSQVIIEQCGDDGGCAIVSK